MKILEALQSRLENLIFGKSIFRFEEKLLLLTALLISVILFFGTISNIFLRLKLSAIVFTACSCIYFLALFAYGRFISINWTLILIESISFLVFLDLLWLVNFGSDGTMLPTYVVYFSFLILVFDKKYFLAISIVLFLNLLGLYFIEAYNSELIGTYPDRITKMNDIYVGMVFSLISIFSFTYFIKKNYIKEFERAKKSDELKSAFVANMSHEIRTPLNAIVGFSSLMSDPDISDEDKLTFEVLIQRNSDYLLHLIQDIIDVSKIESNQLSIKVREFDVVPVIRQIVESFQLTIAAGRNLEIVSNLIESRILIAADQLRLEQILRNLVSNAMKFTENGVIEIGCRKDTGRHTFWVKDNGIGIDQEHQKIIFDRFIKIDNDKQHLHRGTGIGLFISKQLVELFKGKIWVESETGKGSTFFFTLPTRAREI